MNTYTRATILLLIGLMQAGLVADKPVSPVTTLMRLGNGTVSSVARVDVNTAVTQDGYGDQEAPTVAKGSASVYERKRQLNWKSSGEGLETTFQILQLKLWQDGSSLPAYDSNNAFERSEFGDAFGQQWDRFMKKQAKLVYKTPDLADTLTQYKQFFTRWGQLASLPLADQYAIWSDFFVMLPQGKKLVKGEQWQDTIRTKNYEYVDQYVVVSLESTVTQLLLKRLGTARSMPWPADGKLPGQPGMYNGPIEVTATLTVDPKTAMIKHLDMQQKAYRFDIKPRKRVDIVTTSKITVDNN